MFVMVDLAHLVYLSVSANGFKWSFHLCVCQMRIHIYLSDFYVPFVSFGLFHFSTD